MACGNIRSCFTGYIKDFCTVNVTSKFSTISYPCNVIPSCCIKGGDIKHLARPRPTVRVTSTSHSSNGWLQSTLIILNIPTIGICGTLSTDSHEGCITTDFRIRTHPKLDSEIIRSRLKKIPIIRCWDI